MAATVDGRFIAAFCGGLSIGCVVGIGVGYLASKKHMQIKYDKLAQREIDEARAYYLQAKSATEARLKAPIEEVVEYLGYVKEAQGEPEEEGNGSEPDDRDGSDDALEGNSEGEVTANIFHGSATGDLWDYEVELAERAANPGIPYVIHVDEYGERHEDGFETTVLTYYEGDNILSDERDDVIDNVDEMVGLHNLERFGHGTDNINVVIVRNELLRLDIEILKSPGTYAEDVQGFLQHNYAVEKVQRRQRHFDDDSRDQ